MQDDIETQITGLSDKQKAVFAGLVCERLLPQYEAFCKAANWGSPAVYERGLEILYNSSLGEFHRAEAAALLEKLELVQPGLTDFTTPLTAYALDACIALEEALQFLIDKQESHLHNCATAATDSVEAFVQEYRSLSSDRRDAHAIVAADAFMQAELARQHRLLDALLALPDFDSADIHALRRLNGAGGIIDAAWLR
ncbi:DUF416 family protein [Hymenobacter busanensis]|uniref:DUF416 family protein n=1 Tax=Hymenobacter busanensis TaxID=2607656 RepID=A0A7L4ZXD5_9BACT|nr:DUF416 family protein [Hymenobacter busanensis]KAA9332155.1 DUF416 family protein [Hymenobacter busanensis]QHJ07506.1 DUF416 family protein [Hymenobacter busanensis]